MPAATPDWLNALDYANIQLAVDALPASGGVVYVPSGTYNSTSTPTKFTPPLVLSKPVHLLGDGPGTAGPTTLEATVDQDLIQLQADSCTIEGIKLKGKGSTGTGVGIRVMRTGAIVRQPAVIDVLITDTPSWGLYIHGNGSTELALNGYYERLKIQNNKNSSTGALYIGQGVTTQTFINVAVNQFSGLAAKLERCLGIRLSYCIFEDSAQLAAPAAYMLLEGVFGVGLDNCWFESHGATDAAPFLKIGVYSPTDPLKAAFNVDVLNCRFNRNDQLDLKAIVIDGACRSINIHEPDMFVQDDSSTGVDDILINSSAASADVVITGGQLTTSTQLGLPYRLSSGSNRSVTLLGSLKRVRVPSATASELLTFQDKKSGDMVFNDTAGIQTLQVFDGTIWRSLGDSWVNARDYPTLQSAVDSLPAAGGVVFIPAGTYNATSSPTTYVPPLTLPNGKRVRLIGAGTERTILSSSDVTKDMVKIEGDDCSLDEMTLKGPNATGAGVGVLIGRAGGTLVRPFLINLLIKDTAGWAIKLPDPTPSNYGYFQGVECRNNFDVATGGIYIGIGSSRYRIENCRVSLFRGYGIYCNQGAGISLADSSVQDSQDDSQVFVRIHNSLFVLLETVYIRQVGASQSKRLLSFTGDNRAITATACSFVRQHTVGPLNPYAIDVGGNARGVLILNPELSVNQAVTGTDHIVLTGGNTEAILVGGVLVASGTFPPIAISDTTTKSIIIGGGQTRVRVPRVAVSSLTTPRDGDLVYDPTDNKGKMYGNGAWNALW